MAYSIESSDKYTITSLTRNQKYKSEFSDKKYLNRGSYGRVYEAKKMVLDMQ